MGCGYSLEYTVLSSLVRIVAITKVLNGSVSLEAENDLDLFVIMF